MHSGRIKYLTLTDANRVWMPDLFFQNEKEGHFHNIIMPNVYIRIFPYGSVLYSIRYVVIQVGEHPLLLLEIGGILAPSRLILFFFFFEIGRNKKWRNTYTLKYCRDCGFFFLNSFFLSWMFSGAEYLPSLRPISAIQKAGICAELNWERLWEFLLWRF